MIVLQNGRMSQDEDHTGEWTLLLDFVPREVVEKRVEEESKSLEYSFQLG
jgi:hypothetical protein